MAKAIDAGVYWGVWFQRVGSPRCWRGRSRRQGTVTVAEAEGYHEFCYYGSVVQFKVR